MPIVLSMDPALADVTDENVCPTCEEPEGWCSCCSDCGEGEYDCLCDYCPSCGVNTWIEPMSCSCRFCVTCEDVIRHDVGYCTFCHGRLVIVETDLELLISRSSSHRAVGHR